MLLTRGRGLGLGPRSAITNPLGRVRPRAALAGLLRVQQGLPVQLSRQNRDQGLQKRPALGHPPPCRARLRSGPHVQGLGLREAVAPPSGLCRFGLT